MAITKKTEKWLGLVAYPGYDVSSFGRVRSYRYQCNLGTFAETPRLLTTFTQKRGGYVSLMLRLNGKSHNVRVHQLVLTAFVGPCPEGMEGCHFPDRDRTNNWVGNLRWDTPASNAADRKIHGTDKLNIRCGESSHFAKLDESKVREIIRLHKSGRSGYSLAKEYGVKCHSIYMIVKRRSWKHVAI